VTKHSFSTSPSYLQSLRGLHRLHELARQGQNDSLEADAIRDGLEKPWHDLSTIEQARLNGLSEDLYSISDACQEPLPPNPQVQRKLFEAFEANQAGKWDLALTILRRWNRHIDTALLSFLRGSIWEAAADSETAGLFFEHAASLAPQFYQGIYLFNLRKTDAHAAINLAKQIFDAEQDNPPSVVVTAANILFDAARNQPVVESHAVFEQLIPAIERSLARSMGEQSHFQTWSDDIRSVASLLLAGCLERLGDSRTAIRHLNAALAIDPNDAAILEIRGILRYGVEPAAVDDFRRAAQLGSQHIWPSFYLAHNALVGNQFEDCRRMCEQSLKYPANDEVQANIYEWMAISRFELGDLPERVRSDFEEAIRLTPDLDRIRQNFAAFENAVAHPHVPRISWLKPTISNVKSIGRPEVPPRRPIPLAA
jgi:tetratricopeptide (TPR) repeat protein